MLQRSLDMIDAKKLEAAFEARAGKGARGELAQLANDLDVKKYLKVSEPAKLARLANNIVETVDRHALLVHSGLARSTSPISTGNEALLRADPEEKSLDEADRFVRASKSARLKRFLDLQVALAESFREATDAPAMLKLGPVQLTPNVSGDLEKLCVLQK
jgi:hypothetical protein